MTKYSNIEIVLKNGQFVCWEGDKKEWDNYAYDGKCFIIKRNGTLVGIYNMDNIVCAVVKDVG